MYQSFDMGESTIPDLKPLWTPMMSIGLILFTCVITNSAYKRNGGITGLDAAFGS